MKKKYISPMVKRHHIMPHTLIMVSQPTLHSTGKKANEVSDGVVLSREDSPRFWEDEDEEDW